MRFRFYLPLNINPEQAVSDIASRRGIQAALDYKKIALRRRGRKTDLWELLLEGPPESCYHALGDFEDWLEARGVF